MLPDTRNLTDAANLPDMRLYFTMPEALTPHYKKELEAANASIDDCNLALGWHHLERAHIIGQKYPVAHTYVHWKMLQFGFRIKSAKEIIGQIPRLLLGGVKSFVGTVPVGNTGGANVPPLRPMPISEDIAMILKQNS